MPTSVPEGIEGESSCDSPHSFAYALALRRRRKSPSKCRNKAARICRKTDRLI